MPSNIKDKNPLFFMNKTNNTKPKTIEVAVRMRPLLQQFEDEEAWSIDFHKKTIESLSGNNDSFALHNITNISTSSGGLHKKSMKHAKAISGIQSVEKNNQYEFMCDYAFGPDHQNQQIYDECCQRIIKDFIINQKNGTIFMYGQTTSGKTYTMLGDHQTEGIITFSLQDICASRKNNHNKLLISYFEIYNEQINDLLHPGGVNLKIVDDKVYGAQQSVFDTYEDAIELLQKGEEQRSYSEKKYHDHSSRSHTIFQIKQINPNTGKIKAVLNLVDLAGSERISDDEANDETGFINKSLFMLSNVINRLASCKKKDSKLTRILGPSLIGQSSTIVICTISPASINFYQTLSTLRFASCSRKVKLKPKTSSADSTDLSLCLEETSIEMTRIQKQNEELKTKLKVMSGKDEKQFLQLKLQQIYGQVSKDKKINNRMNENEGWKDKVGMLCREYQKNIVTLQKQYTKAMINAISVECDIDRDKLSWAIGQFGDM